MNNAAKVVVLGALVVGVAVAFSVFGGADVRGPAGSSSASSNAVSNEASNEPQNTRQGGASATSPRDGSSAGTPPHPRAQPAGAGNGGPSNTAKGGTNGTAEPDSGPRSKSPGEATDRAAPLASTAAGGPTRTTPPGAVELPGLPGVHAWVTLERAPQGVRSDPSRVVGAAEVVIDRRPPRDVTFRVSVRPEGALELPPTGTVVIDTRRDFVQFPLGALVTGSAVLTFELLSTDGTPTGTVLALPVEVASLAAAEEPMVRLARPDLKDMGPGCCQVFRTSMSGLCGLRLVTLRLMRSSFRDLATRSTEVKVTVSGQSGVIAPLPQTLTIAAGATESAPFDLVLGDTEGRARLVFQSPAATFELDITSQRGAWKTAESLTLPANGTGDIEVRLDTRPMNLSGLAGASAAPQVVEVMPIPAPMQSAMSTSVPLAARGVGNGKLTLTADGFPPLVVGVHVVAPQVTHMDQQLRILDVAKGQKGVIVARVLGKQSFAPAPEGWKPPPGVVEVTGFGTPTLRITLDAAGAAIPEIVLPARVEGVAPGLRIAIDDGSRPAMAPYRIEVR